jgi:hypothetical protein
MIPSLVTSKDMLTASSEEVIVSHCGYDLTVAAWEIRTNKLFSAFQNQIGVEPRT